MKDDRDRRDDDRENGTNNDDRKGRTLVFIFQIQLTEHDKLPLLTAFFSTTGFSNPSS